MYKTEKTPDPADFQRWAHKYANILIAPYDERHDDLVQEALTAIWQAMLDKPDASAVYYATAGKRAMVALLRGRAATGSGGGQHYRPVTSELPDAWEQGTGGPSRGLPDTDLSALVADILATLSPVDREIAARRAVGESWVDISESFGRARTYAHTRWWKYIRPHLAAELERRGYTAEDFAL